MHNVCTCSSIFHMTSCLVPPTLRITLLCDFLLIKIDLSLEYSDILCDPGGPQYLALMITSELGILSGDSAPSLNGQDNVTSASYWPDVSYEGLLLAN